MNDAELKRAYVTAYNLFKYGRAAHDEITKAINTAPDTAEGRFTKGLLSKVLTCIEGEPIEPEHGKQIFGKVFRWHRSCYQNTTESEWREANQKAVDLCQEDSAGDFIRELITTAYIDLYFVEKDKQTETA